MIKCYPDNALPNKKKILDEIERAKQDQLAQANAQLESANQSLLKASKIISAQSSTVEKAVLLVNENQRLKEQLIAVTAEYTLKMTEANQALMKANTDASQFAKIIKAQAEQ
jgi:cellobiose-specific phosphotransferase system component IIA